MAGSIRLSSVYRLGRTVKFPIVYQSLNHKQTLVQPHMVNNLHRGLATEEAKAKPDAEKIELTENEKKYTVELERLNGEVTKLTEKANEFEDKYKRALADGENMRRRLTKQIEDAKLFGIQSFCKDLLDVADILGAATSSVPKEEINDKNPHLKSLYEGLTMTTASLQQVFTRHGLVPVNPLNEKFNPNFHEALFQQVVKDGEPNVVVTVNKIGYKLHERCIRPALVGVSVVA